ncbi:MAG: phosphate ABC transporter substrate-binding protein [Nitrospiraceae bacterium]|nr:MAG: phosphate ABC transporter substrate-binding protein [Nitrospiraceae bacterium]
MMHLRHFIRRICLLLFSFLLFQLTGNQTSFADEIKIGAGMISASSILNPIKASFEKATGMQLIILTYGSKAAMKDLDKNTIDAAMGAHTVDELVDLLKKDSYEIPDAALFHQTTVEEQKDCIIILSKENPVSKLNKEHVKGLFSGKIENWKELGGADRQVIVVWGKLLEASNNHFVSVMLDNEQITGSVLEVVTIDDVKQTVASLPEAIAYIPASLIDSTIKRPEAPVSKTKAINIITKGNPSARMQQLIDYIKGDGQKYIKK